MRRSGRSSCSGRLLRRSKSLFSSVGCWKVVVSFRISAASQYPLIPVKKPSVVFFGESPTRIFSISCGTNLELASKVVLVTLSSFRSTRKELRRGIACSSDIVAFTVPCGIQDIRKPLFLDEGTFMLFIVSDAIALFSSSTSVLRFLGILTSRYAEGDFLYALPKRLTIGLLSLFMSLVATMIAFSATLALVLQDKVTCIAAPLVATSIPVCLFVLMQFPLLVELVYSTYGPSIFHKQNDRWIH